MKLKELQIGEIFNYGGYEWIKLDEKDGRVIALTKDIICEKEFDEDNHNDWRTSTLREYLNEEFFEELIENGAKVPEFLTVTTDLTADDGMKDYGQAEDLIALITCDDYRKYREHIEPLDNWWWTSTPYSCTSSYSSNVRGVNAYGTLNHNSAYYGNRGVRPLCNLQSEILISDDGLEQYSTMELLEELTKRVDEIE